MAASVWLWAGFNLFVLALLAFDLGLLHRREREISLRESLGLSGFYVVLALLFNAGVFWWGGTEAGLEFLTGYLIEKSLSLDNVFVIALIFGQFAVPPAWQHRVLFWGILGALVMRAILIFAGIELIETFRWIVYLFGGFLVLTGIKMLAADDHPKDVTQHPVVRFARARWPVTDGYRGNRFFVRDQGVLQITPLFLALLLIEITDLVFAVDSIPAILAITQDPFIVYTSNVFAILGLRALYFALADLMPRFVYLKYGLSLVLVAVGVKMMLVDLWKVPTGLALGVTLVLIGGSIGLSMLKTRTVGSETAD